MAWWCRQAGAYLVAQLVPSGGALDDDGAAAGGQVALGAQVGLLTALELNASAPPRDESSESMSSSTAGRPGARRGAAGAAEGLCGAEGLLPGGLSSRSPSSSDKRLSTSAIAQHQPTPVAQSQNTGERERAWRAIDKIRIIYPARPQRLHGLAAAISRFARLLCEHSMRGAPYLYLIISAGLLLRRGNKQVRLLSVTFRHRRVLRALAHRCYELAGSADLAVGVGGEGVPRSPDAHAGAPRSLSRSCLQRSRGRSLCLCPLENPGSIGDT